MLDDGVYSSVSEIGDAENISKSFVSRILRLALLAPDNVEGILAGKTNQALMLEQLERPLPASWQEQQGAWDGCGKTEFEDGPRRRGGLGRPAHVFALQPARARRHSPRSSVRGYRSSSSSLSPALSPCARRFPADRRTSREWRRSER